ncbi:TPA: RidA family protein [Legionella pneumophila subsp. pneumophila]|uniref:RidA family protein n=2 Tax=Legionella pneumophila TaxID=446 RepID=A0A378KG23_LEGPN|nr:RidA family protein [Legionella pneumophila]AOW51479.1 reactive intermediate/imine deaminase [Legionella pneumophila subsp. pneumophila]AOW54924.1 reactive intermediate/imine deaminase [Legionella pneumophila subsp. pneumophila]AOW56764.1 reactive intermediate/imine deaminase [Legionella pneumophila subsp. pneumophila]AOW60308.1 reactive intermediate/imine deaminase [Legionella pneumophila subsp. pneumophila]AOW64986.1 reactive intermediate/imine deaminase [Legionella pneumophila subsp. pne
MQPINTKLAPKAIGTYSQAIKSGEIVFLSGQIPLDPETMQICSDDIKLQITQVLENLSAVCEEAGGSLANIVKLNVYLTDLSHFPLINEAMSRYFSEPYPARAAIEVSALPKGAKVEMDGILVLSASA